MAIAFSHSGTASSASAQTVAPAVTINASDTVYVAVADTNGSAFTVTDNAAGGSNVYTFFKKSATSGGFIQEFSTSASGAKAATTVTVTTAATAERISAAVATYTGVTALGKNFTATGSSTAPLITAATQDANNVVVAGFNWFNSAAITIAQNDGTLRTSVAASATIEGVAIADNTFAIPSGSLKVDGTLSQTSPWGGVALELRTSSINGMNANPIVVTQTMATGWKAQQTLFSSATTAVGFRPQKVLWTGRTISTTNSFVIQDPNDSTVLLQGSSVDGANPLDIQYDFEQQGQGWRDFEVTTLTSGVLLIWYK